MLLGPSWLFLLCVLFPSSRGQVLLTVTVLVPNQAFQNVNRNTRLVEHPGTSSLERTVSRQTAKVWTSVLQQSVFSGDTTGSRMGRRNYLGLLTKRHCSYLAAS